MLKAICYKLLDALATFVFLVGAVAAANPIGLAIFAFLLSMMVPVFIAIHECKRRGMMTDFPG